MDLGRFCTRMGVLQAGLCLALAVQSPMASRGQEVSPRKLPVMPVASQESIPSAPDQKRDDDTGAEVKASAPADAAQDPAGDGESSFWSKVPPVAPLPRAGVFLVLPTGPGYYSLKDWLTGNYRESPPKFPYPPVGPIFNSFFDADYRYLEDPNNNQFDWVDPIKRVHVGDNWLFSFGGEERVRYMNEIDSRLSGKDNDYTLIRSRVYGDMWYRDIFRVYVEYFDAQSAGQDLAPLAIDRNHSDLLNLFADLKLFEYNDHPAYFRIGRQELLYGSQRLISPLDWANTRRTFQGVKAFWHGDKFDVDAFWVQPVLVSVDHFDSPDSGREFAGVWTTYRPKKGTTLDTYFLHLDNSRPANSAPLGGRGGVRGGYSVNTIGSRFAGDQNHVLWDFEGMYQFGEWVNEGDSAGAVTTSLGYDFADLPMKPQFWLGWDYASGTFDPARAAQHGTFNQLFPFGHYYFGFLDLVGRQNISDLNMEFAIYPTNWITMFAQYHMFRLDSAKDALYNTAGTAIRRDPTGRSGTDVGDEIDLVTNFHLSQHQDILVGYSKLYAGAFIKRTGPGGSPELTYVQYCFKW